MNLCELRQKIVEQMQILSRKTIKKTQILSSGKKKPEFSQVIAEKMQVS